MHFLNWCLTESFRLISKTDWLFQITVFNFMIIDYGKGHLYGMHGFASRYKVTILINRQILFGHIN